MALKKGKFVLDIHFLLKNNSGSLKKVLSSQASHHERTIVLPSDLGCGVIRKIRLECGIELVLLNYKPSGSLVSSVQDATPVFGFNFSLSGKTAMTLGINSGLFLTQGQSNTFYYPEKTGTCQDLSSDPIIRVSIQIQPRVFNDIMKHDMEKIPPGLRFPAQQGYGRHFNAVDIITPSMQSALNQIIHCPHQGTVRRLFLEGKVMELTALKLEQLTWGTHCKSMDPSLKSDDLDRVKEAMIILSKNFQDPPTLFELSRRVGMSRTKLLVVFKKACCNTPAGYVRNHRLEKARQLLENGEMNVSEAAYFVGYSSLSHFASVFKQYHGILPGRLLPALVNQDCI